MITSITQDKEKEKVRGRRENLLMKYKYSILAVIFWIFVWQMISLMVNKPVIMASPMAVVKTLISLSGTKVFWLSIFLSFWKIICGFLLALLAGSLLAVLSHHCRLIRELVSPLIKIVKAIPVASFIILALIWIQGKNLSILTSFLMVTPVIYSNVLEGLSNVDGKMLEMAQVFNVGKLKKIRFIYIPSLMPYFVSACSLGLGFCWKSGIAAEVIGLPDNSIGEQLYEAKLYFMTSDLFAWTIVIVIISVVFEKVVMNLLKLLLRK